MASGKGISGVAVAIAAAGALVAYAGFRGVSPLDALRDLGHGRVPKVPHRSANLDPGLSAGRAAADLIGTSGIVRAALQYKGDQYSQARRWQDGYSDCSSFVGKALKAVGIDPPPGSTTAGYYLSDRWMTIPLDQARAGDIVVSATAATIGAHMVLVTGPGQAIGQQNSRDDVETGSIKNLMAGTRYKYIARRYIGGGLGGEARGSVGGSVAV